MTAPPNPSTGDLSPRRPLSPLTWIVALLPFALHMACAGNYGIFRDEYYYLMCADHPAWGYVDHPPLAMVVLTVWKAIVGTSVLALRALPAALNTAAAVGAGLLAREMRGTAAAQTLAAALVGFMPGILALSGFYSMNPFDVVFWIVAALVTCRLLDDRDRRWWWALGATVGLGVLNKYSMLFMTAGLGVGLLLSPRRRELWSRPVLTAAILVAVLVLPHLIWQIGNGWPTVEFIRNAHAHKNVAMPPAVFWSEQMLMAHPAFTPFWLIGLAGLLFAPRLRRWRPLGVAFVVVGVLLTVQHAKPYYLVPAYPMAMAGGAILISHWFEGRARLARAAGVALPTVVVLLGLAVSPMVVPVLGPRDYVRYEQALGLRPREMEQNAMGALPQHFADRFGWRELAATVATVHADLPADERDRCLIVTVNYGECGAINHWGRARRLPTAVSGHNSCFTWWPEDGDWAVALIVGVSRDQAESMFARVDPGAVHDHPLAVPGERRLPIWVCREPLRAPSVLRAEARFAI